MNARFAVEALLQIKGNRRMLIVVVVCLGVACGEGVDQVSVEIENQKRQFKELGANVSTVKDGHEVYVFDSVTDRLFDRLDALPNIRVLSFGVDAKPTQAQLLRVSRMKDLRVFSMSRRSGDPGEALRIVMSLPLLEEVICDTTDIGVRQLKSAPWLKRLDLGYSPITNTSMKEIGQIKSLNRLSLNGTIITNELDCLCELEHLKHLSLEDVPISDDVLIKFLKHFKGLSRLEVLHLSGTFVSDNSMVFIGQAHSLTTLSLARKVTATGLRYLEKCTQLEELFLDDLELQREEVEQICKLLSLKSLVVTKATFNKSFAARIRKSLPNCEIHQVGE